MSYKRSSLMQERMEQNRNSILQSARELIAEALILQFLMTRMQELDTSLQRRRS